MPSPPPHPIVCRLKYKQLFLPVAGRTDYPKNAEDPELDSNGIEFVLAKFGHISDGLPFRVVNVLPNACVGIHARSSTFGN